MFDNLWFLISNKLNEYEIKACNLLARHNLQNSWRIVTLIGNFSPVDTKIPECDNKTDKTQRKINIPYDRGVV